MFHSPNTKNINGKHNRSHLLAPRSPKDEYEEIEITPEDTYEYEVYGSPLGPDDLSSLPSPQDAQIDNHPLPHALPISRFHQWTEMKNYFNQWRCTLCIIISLISLSSIAIWLAVYNPILGGRC